MHPLRHGYGKVETIDIIHDIIHQVFLRSAIHQLPHTSIIIRCPTQSALRGGSTRPGRLNNSKTHNKQYTKQSMIATNLQQKFTDDVGSRVCSISNCLTVENQLHSGGRSFKLLYEITRPSNTNEHRLQCYNNTSELFANIFTASFAKIKKNFLILSDADRRRQLQKSAELTSRVDNNETSSLC